MTTKIKKAVTIKSSKEVKVASKPKKVKTEPKIEKIKDVLELPYYNDDFKQGGKKDVKRSLVLSYFLTNSFKTEKEVKVKDILSVSEKFKKEGTLGVAPNLSGKVRRYLLGIPNNPIKLRIVELDPVTVTNSKGGSTTLITKYKVTPIN